MDFTKMHGIGNDFIVIDCTEKTASGGGLPLPEAGMPALARRLCDRRFGIGADGLMFVCASDRADREMKLWNSDGSRAEMCGNGIRCFAKYVYETGGVAEEFTVDTLDGVKRVRIEAEGGEAKMITIGMGLPTLLGSRLPGPAQITDPGLAPELIREDITADGATFSMVFMNMGVPHAVIPVEDIDAVDFYRYGPAIESHSRFPHRTNVNFVRVQDGKTIKDRVFERGAGETLACGTGACASAVACHLLGLTGRSVQVILPGGTLQIEITDKEILMKGPAAKVFTGRVEV